MQDKANDLISKIIQKLGPVDIYEKVRIINNGIPKNRPTHKDYVIITVDEVCSIPDLRKQFCIQGESIFIYTGFCWIRLDKDVLKRFFSEIAMKIGVAGNVARWYQFPKDCIEVFKNEITYKEGIIKANQDKVLVNLMNGTLEINKGSYNLRGFSPDDFITYQLPFNYDPNAKAPKFDKYLKEVLPEKESREVLAEFIGSIFIKNQNSIMKIEKALMLYGTGSNGKSVMFEIISALLGDSNISHEDLELLTNKTNGLGSRANFIGKLVNYSSEIGRNVNHTLLKQIISGENVSARYLYQNIFNTRDYGKLIMNANQLPLVEHTKGYFRRFIIIPFDQYISPEKQNRNLHTEIIKNELPGVLNWALEGLNRLIQNGKFTESKKSDNALISYEIDSNSILSFIRDYEYIASEQTTSLEDLYSEYRSFCSNDGLIPFSKNQFSRTLEAKGFKKIRTSKRIEFFIAKEIAPF